MDWEPKESLAVVIDANKLPVQPGMILDVFDNLTILKGNISTVYLAVDLTGAK